MTPAGEGAIGRDERDALLEPLASFRVVILAVSGGPDSTALLHLAHGWASDRQTGDRVELVAVTVDHGLRAESAAEAEVVARQSADLGIAHRTVRWDGPAPASGLQAAARAARYRLLTGVAQEKMATVGSPVAIVTAHTADDQAETLVMRLARGSGVDGLAAIPRQSRLAIDRAGAGERQAGTQYTLLRPLLSVPRHRLLATLAAHAIPFADDPSNRDRRFERVRVREALDVLQTLGVSRDALQRSADRLQAAHEVLEAAANDLEARAVTAVLGLVYAVELMAFAAAPVETRARLLRRLLARAGGAAPRAGLGAVETAIGRLQASAQVPAFTLGGCIVQAIETSGPSGGRLLVCREPDRSGGLPVIELAPGESAVWDERFCVAVATQVRGPVQVGPLGDDWSRLLDEVPELARLALPRVAARGIPAFRCGGSILSVPLLADRLAEDGAAAAASRLGDLSPAERGAPQPRKFTCLPLRAIADDRRQTIETENDL